MFCRDVGRGACLLSRNGNYILHRLDKRASRGGGGGALVEVGITASA